jgi:hypothetical protein
MIDDLTIGTLSTRALAVVLKGKLITGKVGLRASMVEMVLLGDHPLPTAG